jgi:hypothetical protein
MVGQNHKYYIYGIFGREITKDTVHIYGSKNDQECRENERGALRFLIMMTPSNNKNEGSFAPTFCPTTQKEAFASALPPPHPTRP